MHILLGPGRLSVFVASIAIFLATGCRTADMAVGSRMVSDSAGIEIILIRPPERVLASSADVTLLLELDIGVIEGPEMQELSDVKGAVRLSDGRVVVGNSGTKELRFYHRSGDFSATAGRDGEGPGEFRAISFIGLLGNDTILVHDRELARVSLFDSTGRFLESHLLTGAILPYIVGVLRSRALVGWHAVGYDEEQLGISAVSIEFGTFEFPAAVLQPSGVVFSSEQGRVMYRGRGTRAFRPFAREGDVAARADAFFVLASTDDRSIRVYGAQGSLIRILRLDIPRLSPGPQLVENWIESWLRTYPASPEVQAWWQHGFRELAPPETIPAIRALEVDAQGNVCVERYPLTIDSEAWYWCFSPDGHFVRSLRLPPGLAREGPHPFFDPQLEIGPDYVLGVWKDNLDVEHVRLYAMVP